MDCDWVFIHVTTTTCPVRPQSDRTQSDHVFPHHLRWRGKLQRMPRHPPRELGPWMVRNPTRLRVGPDPWPKWPWFMAYIYGGDPINTHFSWGQILQEEGFDSYPTKRTWQNLALRKFTASLPLKRKPLGSISKRTSAVFQSHQILRGGKLLQGR